MHSVTDRHNIISTFLTPTNELIQKSIQAHQSKAKNALSLLINECKTCESHIKRQYLFDCCYWPLLDSWETIQMLSSRWMSNIRQLITYMCMIYRHCTLKTKHRVLFSNTAHTNQKAASILTNNWKYPFMFFFHLLRR